MTTITVDVRDFEPDGPAANVTISVARLTITASGMHLVTTASKVTAFTGTTGTFDLTAGAAYKVWASGIAGLQRALLGGRAGVNCSLASLWLDHRVDPITLDPLPAYPSIAVAIADLAAQLADMDTAIEQQIAGLPTNPSVTAAIQTAVAGLVNGSPGALDTLKELADALGDDANYAATVAAALAARPTATSVAATYTPLTRSHATALGNVSGTVTLDCSTASAWTATLTGNTVFNFTNVPAAGQLFEPQVTVVQDATGGRTVTFQAAGSLIYPQWSGAAVTAAAAAAAQTVFALQTADGGSTALGVSFTPPTGAVVFDNTSGSPAVRDAAGNWRRAKSLDNTDTTRLTRAFIVDVDTTTLTNVPAFGFRFHSSTNGTSDSVDRVAFGTDASGFPYFGLGGGSFSFDVGIIRTAAALGLVKGRLTAPTGGPFQTVAKSGGFTDADVTLGGTVQDGALGVDTALPAVNFRAGGSWYAPGVHEQDKVAAQGLGAWNFDSLMATANGQLVSGSVYVVRIPVHKGGSYSKLVLGLNTAGSAFTAGQSFVGLYNAAGTTLLTGSADMGSTSDFGAAAASSNYIRPFTFTTAQTLAPGQVVYAAVMAVATTMPKFGIAPVGLSQLYQIGYNSSAGANRRGGIAATAQTALPSTISPTTLASGFMIWAALQ
jgi:hypothetical protein